MSNIAIKVEHISKVYKLYNNPMDRLKESLGFTRKKNYTEYFALDDINIEIRRGETVGIIGTNGAGKSTILKIITGVLSPTAGSVAINGRISALLELGAGFNMEYTGLENVYLNGTMIGFTREEIDAKIGDILDFADIGDFINQPVKTYSSGMFVRLAFAVAINIDPEILIVDEALSVGDVFFQAKCYKKFEDFKKLGKTILFVSHDLSSISKYCDRVILLNKGKVHSIGNPKEIVDLYKKILVNQIDDDNLQGRVTEDVDKQIQNGEKNDDHTNEVWKNSMTCNSNLIEYGKKEIGIVDYALFDENNQITNIIEKGTTCTIKFRVRAYEQVKEPIFAFTIKDVKGTEIAGTNTLYEDKNVDVLEEGEELIISFKQKIDLQGGEYLIALGITGFRDGGFYVYHRLYDLFNLTVVSSKNTVGFYDLNSEVEVVEV